MAYADAVEEHLEASLDRVGAAPIRSLGRRLVRERRPIGVQREDDDVVRPRRVASCLVFELTETAAISNIDSAVDLAQRLHRHGCGLALDDFGAGFASFSYLKNLPFDYIKIDGDFIRGLADSATDRLLIDAIVTMARAMGRRTIAEFVGDATTSDVLLASGVDYAQGFHIGRPGPVGAVLDTLVDPGRPTSP